MKTFISAFVAAFAFTIAGVAHAQPQRIVYSPINHNDAATVYQKLRANTGILRIAAGKPGEYYYMVDNETCGIWSEGEKRMLSGHGVVRMIDGTAPVSAYPLAACAVQQGSKWLTVTEGGIRPMELYLDWQAPPMALDRVVFDDAVRKEAERVDAQNKAEELQRRKAYNANIDRERAARAVEVAARPKTMPLPADCEVVVQALEVCNIAYQEYMADSGQAYQLAADLPHLQTIDDTRRTAFASLAVLGQANVAANCRGTQFRAAAMQGLIEMVKPMGGKIPQQCQMRLAKLRSN